MMAYNRSTVLPATTSLRENFTNIYGANQTTAATPDWPYVSIQPKQGLILFIITFSGTLANVTALLATIKLAVKQKNAINYLIMALTITDMYGITLCTLPTLLCYLKRRWVGGLAMCNFQGVSTMFASLASGSLATAMAVERLFAIWKPFVYRKFATKRKTVGTVLVIWLSAIVVAIFPLSGQGNFVRNLTGTYCTVNWFAKNKANVAYALFYVTMGVTLVIVVIFCNANICYHLMRAKQRRDNLRADSQKKKLLKTNSGTDTSKEGRSVSRSNSDLEKVGANMEKRNLTSALEKQLAKTVGLISVLFLICWVPFMIRIICNLTRTWTDAWVDVQVARLLLLNFVLDPFLYTLSRKQCRDIVKGWFCCCCFKNGKRINLCPKWFAAMRTKHGSFLSSSGHIATTSTSTNVQLTQMKKGSVDTTPEQSVSDVVVHAPIIHSHKTEENDMEENAGCPLSISNEECSDGFEVKQMHRMHSEVHAKKPKGIEEKTISMPDLASKTTSIEEEEVKVDVGFMYDLAFQRQNSH